MSVRQDMRPSDKIGVMTTDVLMMLAEFLSSEILFVIEPGFSSTGTGTGTFCNEIIMFHKYTSSDIHHVLPSCPTR